jgi:predicted Zn-dependent protease
VATYAYSLFLQGKTSEALELMRKLDRADLEKPAIAVYYGYFLAAAGKTQEAEDYLTLAATGTLLPEEKALLSHARRSSAAPGPPR